jgi:hypothetical protein
VDCWLDAHRNDGEMLEGGDFSVSTQEALRKLSEFGLESPEKALLRLTQFAVAAGCSHLNLKMSRSGVLVILRDVDPELLKLDTLDDALKLNIDHFGLSLLACLHAGFGHGVVQGNGVEWRFDEEGFHRYNCSDNESTDIIVGLERNRPGGFWPKFVFWLKGRLVDFTVLSHRLRQAPMPVKLDGRELLRDSRPEASLLCELRLTAPPWYRQASIAKSESHRKGVFEQVEKRARLSLFNDGRDRPRSDGTDVVLAHLWIPRRPTLQPGSIDFVFDGVIIGQIETQFRLPVSGTVSAHGLDRDLSNLEFVQNQRLRKLWTYLKSELESLLRLISYQNPLPTDIKALLDASGEGKIIRSLKDVCLPATGPEGMRHH